MTHRLMRLCGALGMALLLAPLALGAQDSAAAKPKWSLNLYGFVMVDLIPDFGSVNPNWFDVERPTQLPKVKDEFGKNGNFYESVRQTRFGIKGAFPTSLGELTTRFEFDMFGVGADAGQTTIRLRYAYAQLGEFGIGQTESVFMDLDVFPNTLEYWGPNGMVFFRNIQLRWMPIQGETHLTIALERPGASGDQGQYADRIEGLGDISPRFPLPDLSAQYRMGMKWGYVQVAAILRDIVWDDLAASPTHNLSGHAVGWGVNVSTNYKVTNMDVIRAQVVYGQAIQNYMNDAPIDIGVKDNFSNPVQPFLGVPLPLFSGVVYLDHAWNDKFTSAIGYSGMRIYNSAGQLPSDFKIGQYGSLNLLYTPVPPLLVGVEGIWGNRQNFSDGWTVNDFRLQFSGKFTYGILLGGK